MRRAALFPLLALLAAACGRAATSDESKPQAAQPVPVQVVAARERTVDRTIDIVGSLHANQEATLAAEVDGQVKELLVDIGDRVEAGQVVARLESDMLEASLRQAAARLRSARADEERAAVLRKEGIVSPQEYDRMRTARDAAQAERDFLNIRLAHSELRAPIAGAVTARLLDVGDYARVGSSVVAIAADRVLRLRGEVAERYVPELAVGLDVRGDVDAFPGLTVKGRVARINAALDPKNRSLTVEAEIDNSERKLKPGFFVHGSILTQRGVTTVTVPSRAISTVAGVSRVYVVSEGVARQREVQLGQRFEDEVEIVSGAKAGDRVIVAGVTRVYDGAPVEVTTESAEARRS